MPGRGSQPCAEVLGLLAAAAWSGTVVVEVNTRRAAAGPSARPTSRSAWRSPGCTWPRPRRRADRADRDLSEHSDLMAATRTPRPPPGRRGHPRRDPRGRAGAEFAAAATTATTLRGIARAAGVDPRLVHHYFGRQGRRLRRPPWSCPVRPADAGHAGPRPGPDGVGRAAGPVVPRRSWDTPEGGSRLPGCPRCGDDERGRRPDDPRVPQPRALGRLVQELARRPAELRATLAASQMVGMAVARYVVRRRAAGLDAGATRSSPFSRRPSSATYRRRPRAPPDRSPARYPARTPCSRQVCVPAPGELVRVNSSHDE